MPREIDPRDLFADCAIVWTKDKVCRRQGWQHTQPLPADAHAASWNRGIARGLEPAVTLRTSGLVGFEADGDENAERLEKALDVVKLRPWIVEGRQADDGRRLHVYARAPLDYDLPKVSFRFEGGTIIAALNNYYRVAYEGGPYRVQRIDPLAPPIPPTAYDYFPSLATKAERKMKADLATGQPLAEGSRRNSIFQFACLVSRWTTDADLATDMADVWQQTTCDPPVPYSWVAQQVRGAWVVAEREDRLGCDVTPTLSRLIFRMQAENFADAVSKWTPDEKTVLTLVRLWASPLAKGLRA